LRTKKTNGTTATKHYRENGRIIFEEVTKLQNGGKTYNTYHYDPYGKPISADFDGVTVQYVYDAQGNVVSLLDTSGNPLVDYTYDAWGNILKVTCNNSEVLNKNCTCVTDPTPTLDNSTAAALAARNPFTYRGAYGYYYDWETGLYYLETRYYDPVVGRFINADGQVNGGIFGANLYAYCVSNPVNYCDPDGRWQSKEDLDWVEKMLDVFGFDNKKKVHERMTREAMFRGTPYRNGNIYPDLLVNIISKYKAGGSLSVMESVTQAMNGLIDGCSIPDGDRDFYTVTKGWHGVRKNGTNIKNALNGLLVDGFILSNFILNNVINKKIYNAFKILGQTLHTIQDCTAHYMIEYKGHVSNCDNITKAYKHDAKDTNKSSWYDKVYTFDNNPRIRAAINMSYDYIRIFTIIHPNRIQNVKFKLDADKVKGIVEVSHTSDPWRYYSSIDWYSY